MTKITIALTVATESDPIVHLVTAPRNVVYGGTLAAHWCLDGNTGRTDFECMKLNGYGLIVSQLDCATARCCWRTTAGGVKVAGNK